LCKLLAAAIFLWGQNDTFGGLIETFQNGKARIYLPSDIIVKPYLKLAARQPVY
jgi:hypothetical protein